MPAARPRRQRQACPRNTEPIWSASTAVVRATARNWLAVESAEPGAPLAPNLTPGGELRAWTEEQFITTMRTGVTPSGTEMNYMPWQYKGQMTDDELKAVWAYLMSLPELPTSTAAAQ